ncbi:hypothetical protein FKM82_008743 [Ascaphus truei]
MLLLDPEQGTNKCKHSITMLVFYFPLGRHITRTLKLKTHDEALCAKCVGLLRGHCVVSKRNYTQHIIPLEEQPSEPRGSGIVGEQQDRYVSDWVPNHSAGEISRDGISLHRRDLPVLVPVLPHTRRC